MQARYAWTGVPRLRLHIPMKIEKHNFPIIIITAFVAGILLAMLFGFRPEHGSTDQGALLNLVELGSRLL
jgi:hypothetical protein